MTILISPLPHRVRLVASSGMFVDGLCTSASAMAFRVMLCRVDAKDAFRQIAVDTLHASKFGYVFDEYTLSWTFSCNLGGVAALVIGTL